MIPNIARCQIFLVSLVTGMLSSLCCIDIESPWSRTIFSSWAPNVHRFKSTLAKIPAIFIFRNWLMSDVKKDTRNVGGWWCLGILKSIFSMCSNLHQSNILNLIWFLDITMNFLLCRRATYLIFSSHFAFKDFLTDSSTSSNFMLGIFLNKVGSFAKIFSSIVVLKVASTSSPDLENDTSKSFEAMIKSGSYKKTGLPPKIVLGVVAHFFHKFFDSKIEAQLSNHGFHLFLNIWDLDSREKIVGDW